MTAVSHPDRRAARALVPLLIGGVAWTGSLALPTFGAPVWGSAPLTWALVAMNVAIGIAWVVVYARFLRAGDELQRKVSLEAMAFAMGAGIIGGCAIGAVENAGLVELESELAIVVAGMGVIYALGVLVGNLRYR